jgi:hypothetical protein
MYGNAALVFAETMPVLVWKAFINENLNMLHSATCLECHFALFLTSAFKYCEADAKKLACLSGCGLSQNQFKHNFIHINAAKSHLDGTSS